MGSVIIEIPSGMSLAVKSLFTSNCVALSNFVVEELGVLRFGARLTRADMRN